MTSILLHARPTADAPATPQARAGRIKARESASDRAKRGCGLEPDEHAGTIGREAERVKSEGEGAIDRASGSAHVAMNEITTLWSTHATMILSS